MSEENQFTSSHLGVEFSRIFPLATNLQAGDLHTSIILNADGSWDADLPLVQKIMPELSGTGDASWIMLWLLVAELEHQIAYELDQMANNTGLWEFQHRYHLWRFDKNTRIWEPV